MKIQLSLFVAFTTLVCVAQKKELKTAKSAVAIKQYDKAIQNLNKVKPLIENLKPNEQALFYLLRGQTITITNKDGSLDTYKKALVAYDKVLEIENTSKSFKYSKDATSEKIAVSGKIEETAINSQVNKDYTKATEIYEYLYDVNPNDTIQLYKAAGNAVNGKNYDAAIKFYNTLLNIGFTGIAPIYKAKSVATGSIDVIASKEDMDALVKEKKYVKPTTELSKPLNGEITKNIALIYYSQGKIKEAEAAFAKAKADNPNDTYIKEVEAGMFTTMANDLKKQGKKEEALEKFKKALTITPNSAIINQNIAVLLLEKDLGFVESMNSLGRTKTDRDKYKEYEAKRKANFTEAAKYLENYLAIKESKSIAASLLQVYNNIESPKSAALKAKYGL